MEIYRVSGDLFSNLPINLFDGKAVLVHGCNMKGIMGAGVAKRIRQLYPNSYKEYVDQLKNKNPGDIIPYYENKTHGYYIICNALTQINLGRNAKWEYIYKAFENLRKLHDKEVLTRVMLPPIGCGIGGLKYNYEIFKYILASLYFDTYVKFYIFEDYDTRSYTVKNISHIDNIYWLKYKQQYIDKITNMLNIHSLNEKLVSI